MLKIYSVEFIEWHGTCFALAMKKIKGESDRNITTSTKGGLRNRKNALPEK
jgi:hypothetical protein